jgi:predicted ATP-dependent serine protease
MNEEIIFLYCWNCGNENEKNATKCEVCKEADSLLEITEASKREICEQIKEHTDNFIKEIF